MKDRVKNLQFTKFQNELDDLVSFLTDTAWEYHSNPTPEKKQIVEQYHNGWYQDDRETYWIEQENEKIGLLMIHDINDTIPLFDIKLSKIARGNGIGTKAVHWMTDYTFSLPDKKIRIEAYTRSDNLQMRKTLYKCGFVKEGYLRSAWENSDGTVNDSICYAIIRTDWENKKTTPIKFDDFPF
ncbi:GNAT family N-acetyltransferase [Falsibacillus pallidus]|uniref:RimJ/RimL family protein N-acetyltransferase n=1 Tax=Falsibacillus pallidus TaxID=493781 RepID=A0A370GU87_9BACI|nr:GNAT family protein [Falsibacillus pallidus]RDI45503.1 RimJ/RimL family protein N-acetyltransferase [Falsibacillus pallidus]